MYSMSSMIPLRNQVTLPSWNYPQNVRGTLPIQLVPSERPPPDPTVISLQSQTKSDNMDIRPVQKARPTQIINEIAKNAPTNPLVPPDIPRYVPASSPRFPYSDQEGAPTRVPDQAIRRMNISLRAPLSNFLRKFRYPT